MRKQLANRRYTDRLRLGDVVHLADGHRGVVWRLAIDPVRGRVAHVLDLTIWTHWSFGNGDRRPPVLEPQQFALAGLAMGLAVGQLYVHTHSMGIDRAVFLASAIHYRRMAERLQNLNHRRAMSWRYERLAN